ncbi:hypothetical protein, partial [Pseudomonas taetrolens]|uniref:hypothetical protein n=1 Tax=Pseudomonas taetrolens TaxID=47884 RepID=UPI003F981613
MQPQPVAADEWNEAASGPNAGCDLNASVAAAEGCEKVGTYRSLRQRLQDLRSSARADQVQPQPVAVDEWNEAASRLHA